MGITSSDSSKFISKGNDGKAYAGTDQESPAAHLLPVTDPYTVPINGQISILRDLEDAPQGRHLGIFSTIVLFISRILGSGIFAISSGIYEDCGGSPFLFFFAWTIGALVAFSGLYVYLELGSLVPRSGGTKPFLEFIYDKPKYMMSVAFSLYSLMSGFTISNCLVFGEYFLHSIGIIPSESRSRICGLLILYIAAGIHGVSVTHGIRVQNFIGILKIALSFIMLLTGIYVIFPAKLTGIHSQLDYSKFFEAKRSVSSSTFASAVIKANFAFGGWNSVHSVSNEIKDPVRTFKIAGPVSLSIIVVAYLFTNWAYLVVVPDSEIASSGKLIGSILFEKVFGYHFGKQFLTFAVAVCAGGNIFVVIYTISRVSQESFREGYFPFASFMASNWPYGSPLPALLLSCFLSTCIILGSPDGDIYNYIVAWEGYPIQFFTLLTALGIFILRRRYPEVRAPIRTTVTGALLVILVSSYLLISPLISRTIPNPKGTENWPSYAILAIVCFLSCIMYWAVIFKVLPWLFNYRLRPEEYELSDGLVIKKWVKVCSLLA